MSGHGSVARGDHSSDRVGRLCLDDRAAMMRRRVGPVAWVVLEVLVAAAEHAEPPDGIDHVAALNVRAIAMELGLSKDTVAAALRRLIGDGLVRRDTTRSSSRFPSARYRIAGDLGLRRCQGSSCLDRSDTNIPDRPGPCPTPLDGPTLADDEPADRFEPLRLFD